MAQTAHGSRKSGSGFRQQLKSAETGSHIDPTSGYLTAREHHFAGTGKPPGFTHASDLYPCWIKFLPDRTSLLQSPVTFSENIASQGMTEHIVCIGDIFRIRHVLVQVSFGREACHTMNERFGRNDMASEMHRLSYNGWFYRVLKESFAQAGDFVFLTKRQHYLFGKSMERQILKAPGQLPGLSPVCRNLFSKRLETGHPEDTGY